MLNIVDGEKSGKHAEMGEKHGKRKGKYGKYMGNAGLRRGKYRKKTEYKDERDWKKTRVQTNLRLSSYIKYTSIL
jgi:hypothetical protein